MKYDAYLVDLYGTLVDIHTDETHPALWKKLGAFLTENGAAWEPQKLRAAYLKETAAEMSCCSARFPEIDLAVVFARLYKERGVFADRERIAATAWNFRVWSTTHLRLYAGAQELLQRLRGSGKLILLSNAQRLFTYPELRMLGIADAFDGIFLSSDYGCRKPDPAFFRAATDRWNLRPDRCLMIGNDPGCDIDGARNTGMDTFFIRSALSPKDAEPAEKATFSQKGMDLYRVGRILTEGKRD